MKSSQRRETVWEAVDDGLVDVDRLGEVASGNACRGR